MQEADYFSINLVLSIENKTWIYTLKKEFDYNVPHHEKLQG